MSWSGRSTSIRSFLFGCDGNKAAWFVIFHLKSNESFSFELVLNFAAKMCFIILPQSIHTKLMISGVTCACIYVCVCVCYSLQIVRSWLPQCVFHVHIQWMRVIRADPATPSICPKLHSNISRNGAELKNIDGQEKRIRNFWKSAWMNLACLHCCSAHIAVGSRG